MCVCIYREEQANQKSDSDSGEEEDEEPKADLHFVDMHVQYELKRVLLKLDESIKKQKNNRYLCKMK